MNKETHISSKKETFITEYQPAVDFTNQQLKIFWTAEEIHVEKDLQDMMVNMTLAEQHGVITTLKLFTLYELKAGEDFWAGRFQRIFRRPEMAAMGITFSMFEMAVHRVFYSKINEILHLHTNEFYNSYIDNPVLKERISAIDAIVNDEDDLVSLGGFSLVEGAILYSSFAFLKHFQTNGKNKLVNVVRGINFSLRDENLHCIAGAWAFNELKKQSNLTQEEEAKLQEKIYNIATSLAEHEKQIVDMVFEKGDIDGITSIQMKHFVESRINECLYNFGYKKLFEVKYNPIGAWFYSNINAYKYVDFFSGSSSEYTRDWDESNFTW